MSLERRVKKLNTMLLVELGANKPYAWKWSNDLEFVFQKRSEEGNAVLDWQANETGLLEPVRVYERVRLVDILSHKKNLWVLCCLVPPDMSPQKWEQSFGGLVPYPERGIWQPCDPVWLEPGQEPSEQFTWEVIAGFRRQREKRLADIAEETARGVAKREADNKRKLRERIADDFPAFNGIPGKKENYSFGGVKDVDLAPNPAD